MAILATDSHHYLDMIKKHYKEKYDITVKDSWIDNETISTHNHTLWPSSNTTKEWEFPTFDNVNTAPAISVESSIPITCSSVSYKRIRKVIRIILFNSEGSLTLPELMELTRAFVRIEGKSAGSIELLEVCLCLLNTGLLNEDEDGVISLSDQESAIEKANRKRENTIERKKQEANI